MENYTHLQLIYFFFPNRSFLMVEKLSRINSEAPSTLVTHDKVCTTIIKYNTAMSIIISKSILYPNKSIVIYIYTK